MHTTKYYAQQLMAVDIQIDSFKSCSGRLRSQLNGNKILLVVTENRELTQSVSSIVKGFTSNVIVIAVRGLDEARNVITEDGVDKLQAVLLDYSQATVKEAAEAKFREWTLFVDWVKQIPVVILTTPSCVDAVKQIGARILTTAGNGPEQYAEVLDLMAG